MSEVSLQNPSHWKRLVTATGISNFGDGIYFVALPLLGATLTQDPRIIASLAAATMIPSLIFSLPIGAFVDRLHQGRAMVVVDFLRCLVLATFATLVFFDEISLWHLFILALTLGTGGLLHDISSATFLPRIVHPQDLAKVNGYKASVTEIGNGVLGPAAGGLIFGMALFVPFAVNSLTFGIAALIIVRFANQTAFPRQAKAQKEGEEERKGAYWQEIKEGARWLNNHRGLRSIAIIVAAWNIFGWMPEGVLVLYVTEVLGLGSLGFGLIFGVTSVGAIIGGMFAGRIMKSIGPTRILMISVVGYAILTLPPAFLSAPLLVGAVFFLQGIPLITWNATSTSIRQALVPRELLGRVTSVFVLLGGGLAPIGFILGGFLGDLFGLRAVFLFSGIGLLVAFCLAYRGLAEAAASFSDTMRKASVGAEQGQQ
ncbi:MFS transporter [Natronoglycomyces albus]|uniref:MFS transporter n=1 Tax=Natronoglycomyces albus TaxID=2811108 RepID=A0A895XPA1_9ACTN|nr:MFS transporter [Natronoglycomyces albus]QSB04346.1 MFS transporter [Natronoglycomyces albus]